MWSYLFLIFILVSCIYLGCLVYRKNPKSRDNRLFILLIFWLVAFIISNFLENEQILLTARVFFLKADFISALFLGYFWFLFCYYFLENKPAIKRWINYALLAALSFLVISVLFDKIILNIGIEGKRIHFENGCLFPSYVLYILFTYLGGVAVLFNKFRKFSGIKKIQALYVLIGLIFCSVIIIIIDLFYQNRVSINIFRIGTYSTISIVLSTSYAIVKHRLFDIRSIIQKGVIYSGLFSVLVFLYFLCVWIASLFMRERIDFMPMVPLAIFLTIGIIGVPPLRIFFSKVTDNIFYKDKYDYSKAVYDISEVLNRNIEWEILINEILKKINSILKLNFILLYYLPDKTVFLKSNKLKQAVEFPPGKVLEYISSNKSIIYECADIRHDFDYGKLDALPDKERERLAMISDWSDRNEIELILPIFFEEKLCCIVILGEKLSEEIYSPDDINLLKTFSYQASLTLAKAQLYKKVKDYSNNLEKKVRQRTEKIQNLQEAQKQMMCEIAHGLQTPLTIIRNELEILQEHAENKQEIKDIGKSIVRISDFIYNMLKLAKLDNDKESVKMERLNLSELLHDLIDEYKIITEDKGIDLIYDNKVKKSIYIRANKYEIEDMIGNLVSNSIKYMKDEGKKIVKIKYYINNQTIKLDIEDNGIGIEKDMIAKIFDRFYRVNASVKGSGLGLAICNSIAKRHNGEITVASEINKGSKFTVSLPLLD